MTQDPRGNELRQLKREMVAADDVQVRRLVALVDRVAVRGEADALIAALRPRLAQLRPPRPLRFERLLFLPLDPLILPPSSWRPGSVGIPRMALKALAGVVNAGLGDQAWTLNALIAERSTADTAIAAEAGAQLWPLAAGILRQASTPAGWTEASGLHASEFPPLAASLAALLDEGTALWDLASPHDEPPDPANCERLLTGAAAHGAQPLAMMLALLLARLPLAGHLLQYADDLAAKASDSGKIAPDRALDFLLSGIEHGGEEHGAFPSDVDEIRRAALLLETLVAQSARRPTRAARLERVRRRLDESCRDAFSTSTAGLASELTASGLAVPDPAALEASARHVRRVDAVGRRLGGASFYDTTLRHTAERLGACPGLGKVARLRLAEILLGPDAALALFG